MAKYGGTNIKHKTPKSETTLSGGIRVDEFGLIEILEESILIHGLHNTRVSEDLVYPGFVFNSLDMCGSWHDVLPKYSKPDKVYFRRIGESMPYTEIEKKNKSIKKSIPLKR